MTIEGWSAEAFNQVPDSQNEIHGDRVSKLFGFEGGLVPGVTVSAYLLHPGVVAWGRDFLDRGRSHVRVISPLYDGERFEDVSRAAGIRPTMAPGPRVQGRPEATSRRVTVSRSMTPA